MKIITDKQLSALLRQATAKPGASQRLADKVGDTRNNICSMRTGKRRVSKAVAKTLKVKRAWVMAFVLAFIPSVSQSTDLARAENHAGTYVTVTDERTPSCPTKAYPHRAYTANKEGRLFYGCWRYDRTNIYIQWDDIRGTEVVYPMYLFESLMGRGA